MNALMRRRPLALDALHKVPHVDPHYLVEGLGLHAIIVARAVGWCDAQSEGVSSGCMLHAFGVHIPSVRQS